jgi:predicted secreted protein
MSFTSGLAIYVIIWWVVIFAVLPFGAKNKIGTADIIEGQDAGAPVKPMMLKKVVMTTIISLVLYGVFYVSYVSGLIDFRPPE